MRFGSIPGNRLTRVYISFAKKWVMKIEVSSRGLVRSSRYRVWKLALIVCALMHSVGFGGSFQKLSQEDLADLSFRLFPWKRAVLAREDTWNSLSSHDREAWTLANDVLPGKSQFATAQDLLKNSIPVSVPIRLVIGGYTGHLPNVNITRKLEHSMRATYRHLSQPIVSAKFKIEFLKDGTMDHIRQSAMNGSDSLRQVLMREYERNAKWNEANVLFLLIGVGDTPAIVNTVHAGTRRMSWTLCQTTENVLEVLAVAESAARRLYIPDPLYFPVPSPDKLRVHVHPYTPGHTHQALWYKAFPWSQFEYQVRAVAPTWQTVGFFSTQANAECENCVEAFSNMESVLRDRGVRAVRILNRGSKPNSTFPDIIIQDYSHYGALDTPGAEFNIFVVDTARSTSLTAERLKAFEGKVAAVLPGVAILIHHSSREPSLERLERQMIASVISGAYGVNHPSLYLDANSDIVKDLISRNMVCSLVHLYSTQALYVLDAIAKFGIDPSRVLDRWQYATALQRLNLLIYKLNNARDALFSANNVRMAIHYASSAAHDVHALRKAFGLTTDGMPQTDTGLVGTALSCHFSNIRRGALFARELFPVVYAGANGILAFGSFLLFAVITRVVLLHLHPVDNRDK